MNQPCRVLHIITRLIVGGAQENTLLTCELLDPGEWEAATISGPQTGAEGSLIENARERGIALEIEPTLVREVSPLKDLVALVRLTRAIREGGYTIVHTHSSKAGILGRWAAWLARTPIIVHTVHGWGHHDRQRPLVRNIYIALEKLSWRVTDRLIVVSPRDRDKGLADGIATADAYTVIRSGIETDRFGHPRVPREQMREALGLAPGDKVVGSVGRMSPQKAPLDFVAAAADIAAAEPAAKFVYVGDGPLRADMEAAIAEHGLTDRFVLTGLRRDIPELLAAFDVFVLSSLWEGLPRVIPQAMAAGLPVVATAVDGSAEAVQDGVTGRLTPPGEPAALATAVLEVLADPDRARAMGEAGRAGVEPFSARKMVDDIAELYRELLATKGLR